MKKCKLQFSVLEEVTFWLYLSVMKYHYIAVSSDSIDMGPQ